MANGKLELFNIIETENEYIVCNDCTFKESIECFLQLIEMDKLDGTYKEGFYKIVPKSTTETEVTNFIGAYADFAGMAQEYTNKPKADGETCFYLGKICSMNKSESVSFMEYILDSWNAYAFDIINGNYKYIKMTRMVYESWVEYSNRK